MKKVMKKIAKVLFVGLMVVLLTACSKSVSYKFDVSTGDSIVVKMITDNGETLTHEDGVFSVNDGQGEAILQGFFVTQEMYAAYLEAVETSEATIIAQADRDDCSYLQYQLVSDTHTENNFICWIVGSSTGVVLGSTAGQTEAEQAFGLLSFSY